MIPYGKQSIDQADIDAVIEVLQSDWLTQGPKVPEFEQKLCQYTGADRAVAVNSATSALHIACLALEVGKGDIVWTSPNSFVASSNCALYCGASVDFVDIEISTGNMSIQALSNKLALAKQQNQLPKVVIPVHFAGQSCDMKAIHQLAAQYGFKVIEDASHAIGGSYHDKKVGCCEYSDICVFSFHPVKIITSAEGGAALTNDSTLANTMARLRSHGITGNPDEFNEPSHGVWYYQQQDLGFNYRMTDLHASLGIAQLTKVDTFVKQRNNLANTYDTLFADSIGITPLARSESSISAYHLYVIRLESCTPDQHNFMVSALRNKGVFAHVHYIPIYLQPYYQNLGFKAGYCAEAESYYYSAITLPLYPTLTLTQQEYIVSTTEALYLECTSSDES
ncbi:UDP-4-amino-4,6-dideoxy-N-acetyl-beta-L-altrosamine transaminase [Pseudoalteromonas piscicida]|uniref:UDP-4-amino-4, 6-dideoxy-N-acetyl-beta-L-altrosamine transaminase n=1 Tax=Pseudoalteromonas piscicida TaxID=43662 RepID=A0AAQ2IQL8_PSEO7|nr:MULTISPECIES: UDP-4-amino-4,6-dideoxy-N-acetyl-beta-L-altrosamine transaminase [Pseudoalteromonas]KJY92882.1 spore coat protein [Pseudoalteromonas piscicida]TMN39627.1 UDP-4-amino-4,6-dideoxy-N-acetyl-beta-L-altrosamine transaminase [Pseudoalteromonas piscicida]TMN41001.1 UDP-4-amino-4,6-dideoxy-N-acetyl-beta-L-altrosamine transaminase [Pseudoalteromonas piscicida]TMN49451.1 UDP-4-amino-4,6-dideoxy-N-acetyl-beta-L-altrosamine transaminase [Pseudoalteromonas piscicida]TMN51511.1 UDP-4-amino-